VIWARIVKGRMKPGAHEARSTRGIGRIAQICQRVVVVDDEPDMLALICGVLEDEGYDVICLGHPVKVAHLKGREPQPHLFMLDIMLPTLTGIELAGQLCTDGVASIGTESA
jgi:CheY-like chemotaxis protein